MLPSSYNIILFLQALGGGYMVTMVHCEGGGGCDEETLGHHLAHKAHLSLHVEGLPSGYSRDVHGQVQSSYNRPSIILTTTKFV